jgi:hypothetical protein
MITKFESRDDPDSYEAFYEEELPNEHINVRADCDNSRFVWDRVKSNENLKNHGFTHYLTRRLYKEDKFRLYDGQEVGKDIVTIKTDDGNFGLLCAYGATERGTPKKLILIVRQEERDDGCIRLISGYETTNIQYLRWYHKNVMKVAQASNHTFKFSEKVENELKRLFEFTAEEEKMYEEVYEETIQELVELSIEAAKEFRKQINTKTFNPLKRD